MSGWYYIKPGLLEDSTIGPLDDNELLQLVYDGALSSDTKVSHQTHTKGQWCQLDAIPAMKQKLEKGEADRKQEKSAAAEAKKHEKEARKQERRAAAARKRAAAESAKRESHSSESLSTYSQPAPIKEQFVDSAPREVPTGHLQSHNPALAVQVNVEQPSRAAHSLGIASLVLGIFSFFVAWIPWVGVLIAGVAVFLGVTGLILALVRRGTGIGFSIAGAAVSGVSLIIAMMVTLVITTAVATITEVARESLEESAGTIANDADPAEVKKARDLYASFQITRASLQNSTSRWDRTPRIHLEVTNGTGSVISRAHFSAVYQTPGRVLPWATGEFNFDIQGGLEPGESAEWDLSPNMLSELYNLEVREDAVLEVTVLQLDGADGEPLATRLR